MDRGRVRSAAWLVLDAVLAATLACVLLFPLGARVAASDAATAPVSAAQLLPPLRKTPAPPLRDVPRFVGSPPAARSLTDPRAMRAELAAAARALLGDDGRALTAIAENPELMLVPPISARVFPYPYRYKLVDPLLDRTLDAGRVGAANDLASLFVLASARFPRVFPNAAPIAYSLLNRARSRDACAPQLNLAFLLSTDVSARDDTAAQEFERAARDCPGDPTPLYLLGQFQSLRTVTIPGVGQEMPFPERVRRATATFRRLQRLYPGSPAGWAGEGDAWLRRAYDVRGWEPFTARNRFRRAVALFRRAALVSEEPTIAAGEARAQEGLAKPGAAVGAQRRALRAEPRSARLQVALVTYLEEAHRFREAADVNGRFLAESSHLFRGPGLFPGAGALSDGVYANDADDPLSLGVERLQPLISIISPPPELGAAAEDVSFIPLYHDVFGLTGVLRWCRGWSWRRDLVLAGRPRRALEGLPDDFSDAKLGGGCVDPAALRQAALAEAGRLHAAVDDVRRTTESFAGTPYEGEPDPPLAQVQDGRQNLWRFAGDRAKALEVFRAWTGGALSYDREGEVRYLNGEFAAAARLFATAARRATRPIARAEALLKQGTAVEHDHRFPEARAALAQADELATKIVERDDFDESQPQAAYVSYNARVQLGDTELRARRYRQAERHYAAARIRQKDVDKIGAGRRLVRPEVLDNNEALVLAHLGRAREALQAIDRAVAQDRENPIFLENKGLVLYRLGRLADAERVYRASLAFDPTLFPSANDLGVILAARGRLAEATQAFRRAVGAQSDYAPGWFNLGVTLSRRGPGHLLEAQGAFARAFAVDSGLRSHDRKLIFDSDPFFTTLDLSKPIPPDWQYAKSTSRAPVAVAGLVILLLLLRAGRALGMELLAGKAQEKALHGGGRWLTRLSRIGQGVTPLVAVGVTVGVVLWPLLRAGGSSWPEEAALAAGTLALVGLYLRVRARAGVGVRHFTWAPALPLSIGAAALGLGYAPLPAAEHGEERQRVRVLSVAALAILAVALLVLGRLTEVPLTRALGATALVMTSSVMTPVEPLDGAFVGNGRVGLAASLGLLGLAILVALGIL